MRVGSFGGSESISSEQSLDSSGTEVRSSSQHGSGNTVERGRDQSVTVGPSMGAPPDALSILSAGLMGLFAKAGPGGPDGAGASEMNLVLSFIGNIAAQLLSQQDLAATVTEFVRGQAAGREQGSGSEVNRPRIGDGGTRVGAQAGADAQVAVGPTGVSAYGSFDASIGASTEGYGRTSGAFGTAEGRYRAAVEARASGEGYAEIGLTGARFGGSAYAGIEAQVEAEGRLESTPIVTVGGYPVKAHASGKASAQAGAYAYAEGEVVLSYAPPEAAVTAEAGAFAGARAGVTASTGIGPATVTGTAEVWAGAGAKTTLDAGYHDGKLTLAYGAGVAVGVGAAYSGSVDIDVDAVAKVAAGLLGPAFGEALKGALIGSAFALAEAVGGQAPPAQVAGARTAASSAGAGGAASMPLMAQAPVMTTPPPPQDDDRRDEENRSHHRKQA